MSLDNFIIDYVALRLIIGAIFSAKSVGRARDKLERELLIADRLRRKLLEAMEQPFADAVRTKADLSKMQHWIGRVHSGLESFIDPALACIRKYLALSEMTFNLEAPGVQGCPLSKPEAVWLKFFGRLRARSLLKKVAYNQLWSGGIWTPAVARLENAQEEVTLDNLSRLNLMDLNRELLLLGLKNDEVDSFRLRFTADCFPRFNLSYNTNYWDVIKTNQQLYSLDYLLQAGLASKVNTDDNDINLLRNTGFVFFRFGLEAGATKSSFGDQTLKFDTNDLLRSGWVSMHDMLDPINKFRGEGLETLDGRHARECFDDSHRYSRTDPGWSWKPLGEGGYLCRYDGRSECERHVTEGVFCKSDIPNGFALSLLREMLLLGHSFKNIVKIFEDHRIVDEYTHKLFWIEAKIPGIYSFSLEKVKPILPEPEPSLTQSEPTDPPAPVAQPAPNPSKQQAKPPQPELDDRPEDEWED